MSDKPSLATINPDEVRLRESHRAHLRQAQAAADLVEEVRALRQIIHQQEQRLAAAEAELHRSESRQMLYNVILLACTVLSTVAAVCALFTV